MLNAIGLENVGAEKFFSEKLPALARAGVKPVVSLAAEDWDGLESLQDQLSGGR